MSERSSEPDTHQEVEKSFWGRRTGRQLWATPFESSSLLTPCPLLGRALPSNSIILSRLLFLKTLLSFEHNAATTRLVAGTMGHVEVEVAARRCRTENVTVGVDGNVVVHCRNSSLRTIALPKLCCSEWARLPLHRQTDPRSNQGNLAFKVGRSDHVAFD
jgi:hypothetical protein